MTRACRGRLGWVGLMAVMAMLGCNASPKRPPMIPMSASPADQLARKPYRLGVDDEVRITVWQEPTLERTAVIRPDGMISYPLVGDVALEGLTFNEAAQTLAQRLSEFLKDPLVTVAAAQLRSRKVTVLGEVGAPGPVTWSEGATILTVLRDSRGLNEGASDKWDVKIIREVGSPKPKVVSVDVAAILEGESPDVPVNSGDVVYVPPRPVTAWSRFMGQLLSPFTGTATTTSTTQGIVKSAEH